jgi:hypothetical protein
MEEGIEEYVVKMSTDGEYLELQACAELFDVPIELLDEKMLREKLFTILVDITNFILLYFFKFRNTMKYF